MKFIFSLNDYTIWRMYNMKKTFYKVICEIIDVFGKEILEDVNRGTMQEACNFITENSKKHENATWTIIPMTIIQKKIS